MKTLLKFMIILMTFPLMGTAQDNPLNHLITKYKDQPGFHFLDVSTNMMSENIDKVIHLKLLSFDEKENSSFKAKELYNNFFKDFDKSLYKGLVEVKSSGDNVEMMVKQDGKNISEIVITVLGDTEAVLIAASGNFTMNDLSKFSDLNQCKGFQVLEKLCEE